MTKNDKRGRKCEITRKKIRDFGNFLEIILLIKSYLFFKKSFLGHILVNNIFKQYVTLEKLVFQNAIFYFIF